jgi:hypothetical protein
MESTSEKYKHIKGWGIDADPKNEPTYPMKNYTGDDHKRLRYDRPKQQPRNIEVLHSNERPRITSVFGTAAAPSGLSGMIRRFAFKYSESSFAHWLPLLFADRINVWEGIISDLKKGRLPNMFRERGLASELRYNRKVFIVRTVIKTVVTVLVIAWIFSGRKSRKRT